MRLLEPGHREPSRVRRSLVRHTRVGATLSTRFHPLGSTRRIRRYARAHSWRGAYKRDASRICSGKGSPNQGRGRRGLNGSRKGLQIDQSALPRSQARRRVTWTESGRVVDAHRGNSRAPSSENRLICRASPLTDSNRRPLPYHGSALPAELRGRLQGLPGVSGLRWPVSGCTGAANLGPPLLQASVADARAP